MLEIKNEQLKAFVEADEAKLFKTIKVGFELETQDVNGCSYREIQSKTPERYKWNELSKENKRLVLKNFFENERNVFLVAGCKIAYLSRLFNIDPYPTAMFTPSQEYIELLAFFGFKCERKQQPNNTNDFREHLINDCSLEQRNLFMDVLFELVSSNIEILKFIIQNRLHWLNNFIPLKNVSDIIETFTEDLAKLNLKAVADSSVEGPEIITKGGRTIKDRMKKVSSLFDKYELNIDKYCSFHIHASVPKVNHNYGSRLQLAFMYAVLITKDRPQALTKRWTEGKLDRFFRLASEDEKYTFVAHRGATWEFRCFGNISNSKDAEWCFKTTAKAMQLGYKLNFQHIVDERFEFIVMVHPDKQTELLKLLITKPETTLEEMKNSFVSLGFEANAA